MNRRGYLTILGGTLLAGCTGGSSDQAGTDTPASTPTSTPPPTSTLTLGDVEFPDGVTEERVTTDLLTSHQQIVLGESYTIEWERVWEDRIRRTTIEVGTDSVHQRQVSSNASSKSFYKDSSGGYGRANGGEYYFETTEPIDRDDIARFFDVRDHLGAGNYAPTGVVPGEDGPLIEARATDASVGERLRQYGIESIESYSGSLYVAPDGRIVRWTYEWEFARGDQTRSEEFTYETSGVGATTVSEPDWLATAQDRAYAFTLRAPEDGSDYVAVDVEGGSGGLPSNVYARIYNQGQGVGRPVDVSVDGGDTLYLALAGDGIRIQKQPDFGDVLTLSGTVRVHLSFNGVNVLEDATITV